MTLATHNPRYVCYARAHNRTPAEQLAQDKLDWPGGCMAGFMLWMSARWVEFWNLHEPALRALSGQIDRAVWRAENADAFDVWLEDWSFR